MTDPRSCSRARCLAAWVCFVAAVTACPGSKGNQLASVQDGQASTSSTLPPNKARARADADPTPAAFAANKAPVPPHVAAEMKRHSWRPGCPVEISDLAYLQLSHWGYDDAPHTGRIIVHADVADEVIAIFRTLYESRFPIARMELVDAYGGSDEASMEADNTSGYNCRTALGSKTVFSKHSYGVAIDINPMHNPYQTPTTFGPKNAKPYLNRDPTIKGLIERDGPVVKAFAKHGWKWGGSWRRLRDYHHFEKRLR